MPTFDNRGGPGIMAIPGRRYAAPRPNFDGGTEMSSMPFISPRLGNAGTGITGQTLNSSLVAIGNCTVDLFNSNSNAWLARTTSDGSGNFTFQALGPGPFFMRAVDASGNPVGTTLNGLTPS